MGSGSRLATRRDAAVALVGGILLLLGVFAALAERGGRGWDADILRFAESHYESSIVNALDVVIRVGIGLGAAIAVGAVAVLLAKRKPWQALFFVLAVGGAVASDLPLKDIFRRPAVGDDQGGYSFPSGTAMGAVVIVAAIVLTSSPQWRRRMLAAGVPFVIAYSAALVYAWWHYPSDVVAGWCLALAWVTGLWLALPRRKVALDSRRSQRARVTQTHRTPIS
jgi:membrane-associated phospholipid phosphatase